MVKHFFEGWDNEAWVDGSYTTSLRLTHHAWLLTICCTLLARFCVDLLIIRLLIKPSSLLLKHHVAGASQSINLFVYSPSDAERAVTAKLKRNNAICSVDVFTLITSLVHLARRQRIDRAVIESTATC